ncbi:N-acetylmuramoyl-L-alanine amidase [Litchfieldia salsa]|uniref:N-acetylmuramoyl-L-alanine amidase n=1 Tax=Litchfieldia salsa TaxID=930152 RepID=A0A1H0VZ15_9BACI|nr:N-acetylmuramoyl-L-alanine amidase [Litchfieldia salsa]SDP83747.1 N-acetylmuramoyl-L-alanine amidase [Litchfieldia salsa]
MKKIRFLVIGLLLLSFALPLKVSFANEVETTATINTESTEDTTTTEHSESTPEAATSENPIDQSIDQEVQVNEVNSLSLTTPSIKYSVYSNGIGLQDSVSNGATAGIIGQQKPLEAIQISLENAPHTGGISYKSLVQNNWLPFVSDGEPSGKIGEGFIEAIQINLYGEMLNHYDVYYRVHSQQYGWLSWAKNGQSAGTEGLSEPLEAVEMVLVQKNGQPPGATDKPLLKKPSVAYSTHVQSYGWMGLVTDGAVSGTHGQSKRLEAITINLPNSTFSGGITYTTHVQSYGWLNNVSNGAQSGTSGQSKRLEAIKIALSGEIANYFDVYYRVHSETFGWLGWAKNGESAGTEGLSKRLEAIEIVLVKKGGQAPNSEKSAFLTKPSVTYSTHVETYGWLGFVKDGVQSGTQGEAKRLEAIKIQLPNVGYSGGITYSTHVQSYGWLSNASDGALSGTYGQSKRLEAIKISLTGEIALYYDVYYRVHTQSFGWLGWAKNGMRAGSEGLSKRLEAIEIKLVPKGLGEAVNEKAAYKEPLVVFLDPGHGGYDPGATFGGHKESNLNLTIANKVKTLLLKQGYKVHMSRQGDSYISLLDRSKMANQLNPDIFISIHHNSSGTNMSSVHGIESYYYKYNPNHPSKINSEMHNNPDRILKSVKLTNLIHKNMVTYTGAKDRGTAGQSFSVIREVKMPATLLELGYMNNSSELKKVTTDSYQNRLAKAIADGITSYYTK